MTLEIKGKVSGVTISIIELPGTLTDEEVKERLDIYYYAIEIEVYKDGVLFPYTQIELDGE